MNCIRSSVVVVSREQARRVDHRVAIDARRDASQIVEERRRRPIAPDVERAEAAIGCSRGVEIPSIGVAVLLPHVAGDADDGAPRPRRRSSLRVLDVADALAERAAAGPQPPGQRLADHGDRRIRRRFLGREVAALPERNAERLEVPRADADRSARCGRASAVRLDDMRRRRHERRPVLNTTGAAGRRRELAGKPLVKTAIRGGVGIMARAQHDAGCREPARLEPEIDVHHLDDAADHQPAADEQHERAGKLERDQRAAHAPHRAPFGRHPCILPQRIRQASAPRRQRRQGQAPRPRAG